MLTEYAPSGWEEQIDRMLKDEQMQSEAREYYAPILKEFEDEMYRIGLQIDALEKPQTEKPN